MSKKKLEILVPQYKESDEVIKPLLDSIAIQQNIDFDDIGVIIVNDGTDIKLSDKLLSSYPFKIDYYQNEHKGVSATRNACLDHSTAEYVMFCDIDDMFISVIALWFIFQEIERNHFDTLVSVFMEEGRNPQTNEPIYYERGRQEQGGVDGTFVHGKVHRRKYLLENSIRWNESLTIHEDSYFNILCSSLTKNARYCPFVFYLWRWRDESVCRRDSKYMLKTYNNYIESNNALVLQFLNRNLKEMAQHYVCFMVFDAYQVLNKKEWIEQENQEYRLAVEKRFKEYYKNFAYLYKSSPDKMKNSLYAGIKNRSMNEGVFDEVITLKDWIKHIEEEI